MPNLRKRTTRMTPSQDAAQRAEVCIGQGIKEGLQGIEVPWQLREHIRKVIDTAVAEAVKERDTEIARLKAYRCPDCAGVGWTVQADPHTGDACQVQCERCYANGVIDLPAIVAEARREEREGVIRMCDEHDNQCLDPQGCDVSTISAALRARPTANEHGL